MNITLGTFEELYDAIHEVRTAVFIVEQEIDASLEFDDDDYICIHVIAKENGKSIGTGRVKPDGRIGRMAVLNDYRRKGVGRALMQTLEQEAKEKGFPPLWFNAQVSAIPFYEALGYQVVGNEFMEAEIPHKRMRNNSWQND